MRRLSAVVVSLCLLAGAQSAAEDSFERCTELEHAVMVEEGDFEAIPADAAEALEGDVVISEIMVARLDIFDESVPGEDRPLYRMANRLHMLTRDSTVRQQLQFAIGEDYDPERLRETERLLRTYSWLYDARVVPIRRCGDSVEVAVLTKDVWTIGPTGDFNRSGGESSVAIGVKDENLLGRGETLGVYYADGVDRAGVAAFYVDPFVASTGWSLAVTAADNDDGGRFAVDLRQPYRSLADRRSHGGTFVTDERVEPLYETGEKRAEFVHRARTAEVYVSRGTEIQRGNNVLRWGVGVAHEDHEFAREPGRLQPVRLPDDRQYTYPWVELSYLEDQWVAAKNLDFIQRTEDVFLGRQLRARLGVAPDALGADAGRLVYALELRNAARPGRRWFLQWDASVEGNVLTGDGSGENVLATAGIEGRRRQGDSFAFYAAVDYTWTHALTRDVQLLLGGDRGLRGYPQRFQEGDRRLRFRVEERWFSDRHPFQLFRFGAAAFVDAGRAWFPGDPDDDESGWLANVGVGLRFVSSRLPTDSLLHVDVAVPVRTGGRDVDGYLLAVTIKDTL